MLRHMRPSLEERVEACRAPGSRRLLRGERSSQRLLGLRSSQHSADLVAGVEHEARGQAGQPVGVAHRAITVANVWKAPGVAANKGPSARQRVAPIDADQAAAAGGAEREALQRSRLTRAGLTPARPEGDDHRMSEAGERDRRTGEALAWKPRRQASDGGRALRA